jgi:hypothetical protein
VSSRAIRAVRSVAVSSARAAPLLVLASNNIIRDQHPRTIADHVRRMPRPAAPFGVHACGGQCTAEQLANLDIGEPALVRRSGHDFPHTVRRTAPNSGGEHRRTRSCDSTVQQQDARILLLSGRFGGLGHLAMGKTVKNVRWIEVGRERRLVFGYGLRISPLRPEHLALGVMRKTITGRCGQGLPRQVFRTHQISRDPAVILSMTRAASQPASWHFASTDCGSSANARSNKLIASL